MDGAAPGTSAGVMLKGARSGGSTAAAVPVHPFATLPSLSNARDPMGAPHATPITRWPLGVRMTLAGTDLSRMWLTVVKVQTVCSPCCCSRTET